MHHQSCPRRLHIGGAGLQKPGRSSVQQHGVAACDILHQSMAKSRRALGQRRAARVAKIAVTDKGCAKYKAGGRPCVQLGGLQCCRAAGQLFRQPDIVLIRESHHIHLIGHRAQQVQKVLRRALSWPLKQL